MFCDSEETVIFEKCHCRPLNYAEGATADHEKSNIPSNIRVVDFGEVLPGTSTTKSIILRNEGNKAALYHIHRNSYINNILQSFHFNRYNININPKKSVQLKITYKPILEPEKSADAFKIYTTDSKEIETIFVTGKCLNTKVKCSTAKLYFLNTPNVKNKVSAFELRNTSKVPATFQLDNINEDLFHVNIKQGQIQPSKSIYVTITFTGKVADDGIHYERLVYLIYKHEPIIIDLVAVYNKKEDVDYFNKLLFYSCDKPSSYPSYFYEYGFSEEKQLPIKLSKNNLDFERVLPKNYCQNDTNIMVTTIKNNMNYIINVNWYKNDDDTFQIQPDKLKILPNEIGYFEITFNPSFKDRLYHKIMYGQVEWKMPISESKNLSELFDNERPVPLPLKLNLIGHSFPENQYWISNVEVIPEILTFPPCIPGFVSYATFLIKSDAQLPVLYKIISPKKSDFTVKPLMGMMRNTKFFVARLKTGKTTKIYKEEWKVQINNDPKRLCPIILQGICEIPSIIIGDNNLITFNSTLPGCQDTISVPIVNTSCHQLKIDLVEKNEYFHSQPKALILNSNEEKLTEWTFNGKPDVPNKTKIKCYMTVITHFNELIGLPFENEITIKAICEYSQLCATPRYMDFGDIAWGSFKEIQFKIFNFGTSAVCYSLKALCIGGVREYKEIKMTNTEGKLLPKENITINFSLEAKTAGDHIIQIVYYTRINEYSDALTISPPIDLFSLRFNCIHPILEVQECVEHNLGKIFSKFDIWNFFSIKILNKQLRFVKEGETRILKAYLPSSEYHEKTHYLRFTLNNVTNFDLNASLTRVQLCNCKYEEISKSLSLRQKVLNCPHRNLIHMELSDSTIVGGSFQYLDIYINYNLISNDEIAYNLKLTKDRTIQFRFRVHNVPRETQILSPYRNHKTKRFASIFIGSRDPPYQIYWIYNNTSQPSYYEIYNKELLTLNEEEGFTIYECYNLRDKVEPYSGKPILFKFHPIEVKHYDVTIPIKLGNEFISLKLSGYGAYQYDNLLSKINSTCPKVSLTKGKFPVTTSIDYIIMDPFPVWCSKDKIIHLRNVEKERIMEYTWQNCKIDNVIEITADIESGFLQSEETKGFLLTIKSYGIPAIGLINLSCKIIDATQNEKHLKSMKIFEEKQKLIDQCFIIDEKGTHTLKNKYKIEPPAEEFYITIAIAFHTLSDVEIAPYLKSEQFFGLNPLEKHEMNIERIFKRMNDNNEEPLSDINPAVPLMLECFIMDAIKSPLFMEMLLCEQKAPSPYYIQFKQDKKKKIKMEQLKKHFTKGPSEEFLKTMKYLMKESITQTYF